MSPKFHFNDKNFRCTFPRVVDVTDYATITNRAAQAGTAATGVFAFDLEYFTDQSFSMVSTEADDKVVGETVFFQILPSDSPGTVLFSARSGPTDGLDHQRRPEPLRTTGAISHIPRTACPDAPDEQGLNKIQKSQRLSIYRNNLYHH